MVEEVAGVARSAEVVEMVVVQAAVEATIASYRLAERPIDCAVLYFDGSDRVDSRVTAAVASTC